MARTIKVLPDSVANQIAAGEVVERPASVVKELVENALDAGATSIEITIEGGGKRKIRVSDDGVGMSREDALLSLDRHATSKIVDVADLGRIRTFGFRGEALPSIAAVSRFAMETHAGEEEIGTGVRANGGRIVAVEDLSRRRGTTVDVQNLFFNAPARSKFLKSARAETRAISDAVVALALANPALRILLTSDGRKLLELRETSDLATRISDIWGAEDASTLIPVEGQEGSLSLRGLIQRPDAARPGFRRAHLFVNTRPIREPRLLKAVDRAFATTVPEAARPWLFLYFDAGQGSVDVNVHPAKAEVRFRDFGVVEALVERSVRRALEGEASGATFDSQLTPHIRAVREPRPGKGGGEGESAEAQMALFLARSRPEDGPLEGELEGMASAEGEPLPEARPRLWQILDTYILAETRDGLLVIDQHSAHERVMFERLMRAYEAGGQDGQRLLFPVTLRLSAAEYQLVEDLTGLLSRTGFEAEGFGGDTVIVRAVPNPHPYFDAERCLREMVDELTHGSELVRSAKNQHERIAMTFACKGAIKAGQELSQEEMQELFDALFATELPFHDVHGRPTVVRLSRGELERRFGR